MATILLVDDNRDMLLVVGANLEDAGFKVVAAKDAPEAYACLENHSVDLVILDLMMPETSGFEILKQIRESDQWHNLPVLILSALDQVEARVNGMQQGADDFLVKPADFGELKARVSRLLFRNSGAVLEGELSSLSLAQVLQNLTISEKTGTLRITGKGSSAEIFIKEGKILGARTHYLQGTDALYFLLGLSTGRFGFSERVLPTESIPQDEEPPRIQTVLLDLAYFEDELARRQKFTPGRHQPLRVVGSWDDAIATEHEAVPLEKLFQAITENEGATLELLSKGGLAAPICLALAASILVEHGVLEISPSTAETPPPRDDTTDLDAKIERLLSALGGGAGALTSVHLLVFVEAQYWPVLLSLLRQIPDHFLTIGRDKHFQQLEMLKRGTLRLRLDGGEILMNLQILDKDREQGAALYHHAAGVLVWTGEEALESTLASLIERFRGAPKLISGVIVSPSYTGANDKPLVESSNSWSRAQPPTDLPELLDLLTRHDAEKVT